MPKTIHHFFILFFDAIDEAGSSILTWSYNIHTLKYTTFNIVIIPVHCEYMGVIRLTILMSLSGKYRSY